MSRSPKSQVMFASAFSGFGDFFSDFSDFFFIVIGEFKMREIKLREKVTSTAVASRSAGQFIRLR